MTASATSKMVDSFGRSLEENKKRQAITDAANEEARKFWNDPQWRAEFAADLTESILLGFNYETMIDQWIDTERTDFNGRIFIREEGGLKAFYMARGGYIEASELTAELAEVPRDMVGVHVWEFEDKFLTNFAESANTLRSLAIRRLDAEINRRVLTLLQEAIPTTSPYYLATPGLSKPAVDAGLRAVRDATVSGEVVIVGRPTMVDQIADFDGFGDAVRDQIDQSGTVGSYRGARVISLKNFKDEDNVAFMPGNELYILSKDFGKFAFYGGLQSKEFSELDNWYWHYLARQDTGAMIHHPERARRLIDTSQSA